MVAGRVEPAEDRALKENHRTAVHKKSDRVSIDQLMTVCDCLLCCGCVCVGGFRR
jgi:hypothetical protein